MTWAIYGLAPIGLNGAYEATGEVHHYCSRQHAESHAFHDGLLPSAGYSEPEEYTDAIPGLTCEWCGKEEA